MHGAVCMEAKCAWSGMHEILEAVYGAVCMERAWNNVHGSVCMERVCMEVRWNHGVMSVHRTNQCYGAV
jgi:hypothetical protein